MRPGRWMGAVAVAALLSGCTTKVDGLAVPAADLGHSPALVAVAALESLLLPPEQLNTLLRTDGLEVKESGKDGETGHTSADDCAATWRVAWRPMYAGSGWTAIREQLLADRDRKHRVWQAVVSFPLPAHAKAFYSKQVAAWATCNNRHLENRYADETPTPDAMFTVGQSAQHDDVLTISETQDNSPGWTCQRALTYRNNVVVDIQVCVHDLTDQAETVAKAITAKVPVK